MVRKSKQKSVGLSQVVIIYLRVFIASQTWASHKKTLMLFLLLGLLALSIEQPTLLIFSFDIGIMKLSNCQFYHELDTAGSYIYKKYTFLDFLLA